jgi:hypothetical protein
LIFRDYKKGQGRGSQGLGSALFHRRQGAILPVEHPFQGPGVIPTLSTPQLAHRLRIMKPYAKDFA